MSVGEVLSDARCRSGLSIGEVSRLTRIREEIVWAIELDDFPKCGGDFYARGHIRAIAAAVFVDPSPLIAEYDAVWSDRAQQRRAEREHQAQQEREREAFIARGHSELLALPPRNLPDRPHPLTRSERYRRRHRRRVVLSTGMCLAVLAIFGGEAYHFAHATESSSETAAQAAFNRATTGHQPARAVKKIKPKTSPSSTPTLQTLDPIGATAYGPWDSTGDNPQLADQAIDASSTTAWQSQWYSSANFGGMKSGTGLLIDLGQAETVVSAEINIGSPGAYVELRGGPSSSPTALKTIGSTRDAGAITTIRPQQTPVRYLLIWFTGLPQTSSGTYQASIYNLTLQGYP